MLTFLLTLHYAPNVEGEYDFPFFTTVAKIQILWRWKSPHGWKAIQEDHHRWGYSTVINFEIFQQIENTSSTVSIF